jgi:hypothetical protein
LESDEINPNRIVRLMEAKTIQKSDQSRMIDIAFSREATGDQSVEVFALIFVLVISFS